MNVLVFTMAYPNNIRPNNGVFVKERITKLAALDGYNVKVVAPIPYYPSIGRGWRREYALVSPQELIDDIEVYHPRYIMIPKIGMSLYGVQMFLGAVRTVRQIQRSFDFDLISAHTVYPDGFAGMLLSKYFGKPFVVSARGTDINYYPRFWMIRSFIKRTVSSAGAVVTVCQALKEELLTLNPNWTHIHPVPNGVDSHQFHPIDTRAARQELQLPDKKILLTVGSLIPRKGVHILIEALAVLKSQIGIDDVLLAIVGDGSFRDELQEMASALRVSENIVFAGEVPHAELSLWYNAANIFCLASNREGWPNVIMEALACGKPVVATPVWGIPEIINDEHLGILAERTPEAFADAISKAMRRTWQTDRIVEYARGRSWENVAMSMSRVFESAVT